MIYNQDCMEFLIGMEKNSVDLTLTDIPYDVVNRESNGLRNLDKKDADILTFDLDAFLKEIYRVTKGTVIIFCSKEQLSEIYKFFNSKEGTVRQLIWQKTNPSPMNGQYVYLSGIENAVWFKKRGSVFNAHCKNTVFPFPNGRAKLHPTEKNFNLIKTLIEENSNEGQLVFDPCFGSGTHLLAAKELKRCFLGVEISEEYYEIAKNRLRI